LVSDGLGWAKAIHHDDRDTAGAAFLAANATRTNFQIEYRLHRKDGSFAWVIDSGQPRFNSDGTFLGYVGCVLDISERKYAEEALSKSLDHYRYSVELNPHIAWTAAPDGSVVEMSPRWEALTGMTAEEAYGTGWTRALHPADLPAARQAWAVALRSRTSLDVEYRLAMLNGTYRWFRARGTPRPNEGGRIMLWYGSIEDIHDRKLTHAALRESEERLRLAIEASQAGVMDLDTTSNDHRWSDHLRNMLGFGLDAVPGYELYLSLVHPDDRPYVERQIAELQKREAHFATIDIVRMIRADTGETRYHERHFRQIRNEAGDLERIVVVLSDVTERQQAEDRIRWIATHDEQTQLPNRQLFQQQLGSALAEATASGEKLALVLLDVDDFKLVNDTLGHAAGDALLKEIGARLMQPQVPGDTIGRLGGDEFALLLKRVDGAEDVSRRMQLILSALDEPISFEGAALKCFFSSGASLCPEHGTEASELMKHADMALYSAKTNRRGGLLMFNPEMRADVQRRSSMLNMGHIAVERDLITPFYQPKVDLRTGTISGFEALLRWRDNRGKVHLPGTISAAFEDPRLAVAISERIFDCVVTDVREWLDRGLEFGHIGVNASAAEFRNNNLAERLLDRLHRGGVSPRLLELEVTETVFLGRGSDYVERALRLLSDQGMSVALDDFGTGYASLSHLRRFPVNCIKIDQSFVSSLHNNKEDAAIVDALVGLGRGLNIKVVAEGVETYEQAAHLAAAGCDFAQGHLLGYPMEAQAVPDYLVALRRSPFKHQTN
jgi:diguanylate cyclase (GGDEF)-like protein/PAS domain S-box-containing protein